MSSSLWEIQVALVARLKAAAGLTAIVGQRIYDGTAPIDAVKPYVVIGEGESLPVGVLGARGTEDSITCHVWSSYVGRKEATAILEEIYLALVTPLTLTSWGTHVLREEERTILVDEDGKTRHGVGRYRLLAFAT